MQFLGADSSEINLLPSRVRALTAPPWVQSFLLLKGRKGERATCTLDQLLPKFTWVPQMINLVLSLFLQACSGLTIVSVSELIVALYWNASQSTKQQGCARCLWPCRGDRTSDLQTSVVTLETEFTEFWWLANHNASHRLFSLPVTVLLHLFRHYELYNTLWAL